MRNRDRLRKINCRGDSEATTLFSQKIQALEGAG